MKKFYAFFAAALMSVSVFAAKDVVPSDAVLADYYDQGNVCVCIYVPGNMACNDIILAGSFHKEGTSWITSPVSDLPHFEPVEGYDGWYVASFEPEAEPDAVKGMQAKPVMLDVDGNFNWEYQVGAATVIRGGVQVVAGFSGEIDLINYGADAPNVFTVDAWKQNPCDATYHNYTITVVSDGCGGYVVPFVIGAMNSWTFEQMQLDVAKSQEYGVPTYYYSKKMAEGTPYQIVSGLMDNQGVVPAAGDSAPAWNDIAYMQKLVDEVWGRIPGEQGDNQLTHENAEIVWDLRAEDLRWARCDDSPLEHVVMWVNLPAENCPEAVEIIGGFDAWEGTAMEHLDNGLFFAEIEAKQGMFFKFRGAGSWDHELEVYNDVDDAWSTIADGQLTFGQLWQDDTYNGTPCKSIELDLSAGRWSGYEEGIENVVLTEKAHKVVVDGVIYIVRDNKMFNIQGAQVR
jgi:hypothetical protein